MDSVNLQAEADEFVGTLNRILEGSLGVRAQFKTRELENRRQEYTGALSIELEKCPYTGIREIPLIRVIRGCDKQDKPVLFLSIAYTAGINHRNRYLQVLTSSVGLYTDVTGGQKKPCPIVRVEYLRQRSVSAAHMHIHANSPEITWIYGTAGNPAPNLHDLHFPVGGRRFRPTLEEFLFFLNDEKLFTDWRKGWKQHLETTLTEWERIQARSVVRTYPQEAVETLSALGYDVNPPIDS